MEDRIIFNIDVMLAKRKMSVTRLSEEVGITIANLSVLKNGKPGQLKISTLRPSSCKRWTASPADLLEYQKGPEEKTE